MTNSSSVVKDYVGSEKKLILKEIRRDIWEALELGKERRKFIVSKVTAKSR